MILLLKWWSNIFINNSSSSLKKELILDFSQPTVQRNTVHFVDKGNFTIVVDRWKKESFKFDEKIKWLEI